MLRASIESDGSGADLSGLTDGEAAADVEAETDSQEADVADEDAEGEEAVEPDVESDEEAAADEEEPYCIHVVQYRENLSLIAAVFGVPMSAIMDANAIYNPDFIYYGQRLIIPGCTR